MTIDKVYQPLALEKKWYQTWEKTGLFAPVAHDKSYCIMLPPPNVTGTLHMGHAFQDTLMDTLIRYHRMKGYQTLWQGGTDHAGIATQMVVERQLLAKGITKEDIGRETFTQKVWEWKTHSGNTISQQMRRLGTSIDWCRERFTMDEGLSDAVKEVFIKLHEEGLIYRGQRLVNWDPKLHTAVSDLEVITEEEPGNLWHLRYPIVNKKEYVIVATTRPETMLGDVAVAVNPEDARYQHLIGEKIDLPLCNRTIPIIADSFVAMDFGTGCVKITPAHDFTDYEVGKRHDLPLINIFTEDALLNRHAPEKYQGLDRFEARKMILQDLEEQHLLEKVEPYAIKIPRAERTGEIIEPYLTDQWYVRVEPLAKAAIKVVEEGKVTFIPENWTKIYFDWMHNIQDWCISRQIWWGHRIPAWYDCEGNIYVGRNEAEIRSKHNIPSDVILEQDKDVLDTWFSSALWPFSTLGWPKHTEELSQYYPTNVLVTGFDIIFFWVARMIMMGLKFMDDVPFRKVFIHGLIQDAEGQKMSKSKGNILDPLDLIDGIDLESLVKKRTADLMQPALAKQIEKNTRKHFPEGIPSFGTDALRFTFCAIATTGRHIRFDLARIEGYRNFCNKIWNASRYVLMNVEDKSLGESKDREFSLFDQWITSLWQKVKQEIAQHIDEYRFDLLAQTIYDFTWNHFCDWYLELSKPILTQDKFSEPQRMGTRFTLVSILEELLRAIHPIMPFITEEIWQKLTPVLGQDYFPAKADFIMTQSYPECDRNKINSEAEQALGLIQGIIMGVRTIRGEMNLHPNEPLVALYRAPQQEQQIISRQIQTIQSLAKLESLSFLGENTAPPVSATTLVGSLEIFIPLAGLIDKDAEIQRLQKEIDKLNKEIAGCTHKLGNQEYLQKAPEDVVKKERERLQAAQAAAQKLMQNLEKIRGL